MLSHGCVGLQKTGAGPLIQVWDSAKGAASGLAPLSGARKEKPVPRASCAYKNSKGHTTKKEVP